MRVLVVLEIRKDPVNVQQPLTLEQVTGPQVTDVCGHVG